VIVLRLAVTASPLWYCERATVRSTECKLERSRDRGKGRSPLSRANAHWAVAERIDARVCGCAPRATEEGALPAIIVAPRATPGVKLRASRRHDPAARVGARPDLS